MAKSTTSATGIQRLASTDGASILIHPEERRLGGGGGDVDGVGNENGLQTDTKKKTNTTRSMMMTAEKKTIILSR